MSGQVLIAPAMAHLVGPSIFLAGPIQGAARWQDEAIKLIQAIDSEVHITSPRRPVFEDVGFVYEEQVDWETHYLNQASRNGCILFWMADEFEHVCARSYAQTTRYEYAEWLTNYRWMKNTPAYPRLAIGIDKRYSGQRYIRHRLSQDAPELVIQPTLKDTCLLAVKLARETR